MRQLFLAIHRPSPDHVDDLIGAMTRFGDLLALTPGCFTQVRGAPESASSRSRSGIRQTTSSRLDRRWPRRLQTCRLASGRSIHASC